MQSHDRRDLMALILDGKSDREIQNRLDWLKPEDIRKARVKYREPLVVVPPRPLKKRGYRWKPSEKEAARKTINQHWPQVPIEQLYNMVQEVLPHKMPRGIQMVVDKLIEEHQKGTKGNAVAAPKEQAKPRRKQVQASHMPETLSVTCRIEIPAKLLFKILVEDGVQHITFRVDEGTNKRRPQ